MFDVFFFKILDFMLTTFIKATKKVKIQNQIKKGKPTFSKKKKKKKDKPKETVDHTVVLLFFMPP